MEVVSIPLNKILFVESWTWTEKCDIHIVINPDSKQIVSINLNDLFYVLLYFLIYLNPILSSHFYETSYSIFSHLFVQKPVSHKQPPFIDKHWFLPLKIMLIPFWINFTCSDLSWWIWYTWVAVYFFNVHLEP